MSLDIKRKEVELMRVKVAKNEMELRIAEREDEIKRLKENIAVQEASESKLILELKTLKGE
jgi:hypothetical protein